MYLRALRGFEEAWGAKHTSTLDTVYNLGNLYRDRGEAVEARKMYERAVYGYNDVEGNHEADIMYLRQQLSLLEVTDGEADRGCQAVDRQPPSMSCVAPVRHRKRDFLLRVLKR
jgi:hypothetical protein